MTAPDTSTAEIERVAFGLEALSPHTAALLRAIAAERDAAKLLAAEAVVALNNRDRERMQAEREARKAEAERDAARAEIAVLREAIQWALTELSDAGPNAKQYAENHLRPALEGGPPA